jgi:hypothetical protein
MYEYLAQRKFEKAPEKEAPAAAKPDKKPQQQPVHAD